jgi:hypothetical protein
MVPGWRRRLRVADVPDHVERLVEVVADPLDGFQVGLGLAVEWVQRFEAYYRIYTPAK